MRFITSGSPNRALYLQQQRQHQEHQEHREHQEQEHQEQEHQQQDVQSAIVRREFCVENLTARSCPFLFLQPRAPVVGFLKSSIEIWELCKRRTHRELCAPWFAG